MNMRFTPNNCALAAASLLILAFALLSGLYLKDEPLPTSFVGMWHFNYSLGYTHRGLQGALFQLIYGKPDIELIKQAIPTLDYYLRALLAAIVWAMMASRILLPPRPPQAKWFLLSVCAALLLAPAWRMQAMDTHAADEMVLLAAFAALAMLLLNRPWLYVAVCAIGFLVHPMMLFHEMLLLMLIAHAVVYIPRYRLRWRVWLVAALLPPCLALLLNWINDPQRAMDILVEYNFPETGGQFAYDSLRFHFLYPEKVVPHILTLWEMFPRAFWLGLLIFAAPPAVCALIIGVCLRHEAVFGGQIAAGRRHSLADILHNKFPALVPAARFIDKHNMLIMLPLASIFMLPIIAVAIDWSRLLVWGWWGVMAAFIYLLHTMPAGGELAAAQPPARNPKKRKKRKRRKGPPAGKALLGAATACFFAAAYWHGGSSIISTSIHRPWDIACKQFCIPYLTVNPLGKAYSAAAFNALAGSLFPIHASGKNIKNSVDRLDEHLNELQADENGHLLVPANYQGRIFRMEITFRQGEYVATIKHDAAAAPNLKLRVYNQNADSAQNSAEETQWHFSLTNATAPLIFEIESGGGDEQFVIKSLSIEKTESAAK